MGAHLYTPTKKQSMVWKCLDKSAQKKIQSGEIRRKSDAYNLLGCKRSDYHKYVPLGSTVTVDCYFDTPMHFRNAIKSRRLGLLSKGVILLHDNAHAYSFAQMKTLLKNFCRDVFPHFQHLPDLASYYFHLFPHSQDASRQQTFWVDRWIRKVRFKILYNWAYKHTLQE